MNKLIEKIKNNRIIMLLEPFFRDRCAYLVGGYLRDIFLKKESCDIDIVVPQNQARVLALEIAEKLDAHFVALDEINNIYRVVMSDKVTYVDIADCVGEDILSDLKRRDFTINALAYDLKKDELIDLSGGIDDLKNGIIREISEKNLTDDPLRILRAFRFQSELGFALSDGLKEDIKKHSLLLMQSAKERINVELVKLFAGKCTPEALFEMDRCGVLELIFPIVSDLKKVPPNTHHHLRLFEHCIETVSQVEQFYASAPIQVKEHFETAYCAAQKRLGYLKIAAFLHDIGKPQTWTIEPDTGRHRFIKHDDVGSKICAPLLRELKFSNKQIKYIQKLIKFHIYPAGIVTDNNFNEKAMMRFFRKMEDDVFDIIALAYADRLSAQGPAITVEMLNQNLNGLVVLLNKFITMKTEIKPLPKLLDGKEIMQILNITQSPQLGKIIKELTEAQISGDINSREEAVEFICRHYS